MDKYLANRNEINRTVADRIEDQYGYSAKWLYGKTDNPHILPIEERTIKEWDEDTAKEQAVLQLLRVLGYEFSNAGSGVEGDTHGYNVYKNKRKITTCSWDEMMDFIEESCEWQEFEIKRFIRKLRERG